MTTPFTPRLDILPAAQRRLWDELREVPAEFVLYGGTAIALHLGHRESIDFDFFGNRPFEASALPGSIPFMADAKITQMAPGTVGATVNRGGDVKVSFFAVPEIPRLRPPVIAADNGLQVASLIDLAGTKAKTVLDRAEAKDYLDIDALLTSGSVDLATTLSAARALYGKPYNPESTLKALSYFGDGNLHQLPDAVKDRLAKAAREVDLDRLPNLVQRRDQGRDAGLSR